jgi:hypothetical protein
MKVTRRELAAAIAVVAPLSGQGQPAAEDLDATVRNRMKANVTAMNSVTVPMAVEPAVTFKA